MRVKKIAIIKPKKQVEEIDPNSENDPDAQPTMLKEPK